jgi:hypothetical protein
MRIRSHHHLAFILLILAALAVPACRKPAPGPRTVDGSAHEGQRPAPGPAVDTPTPPPPTPPTPTPDATDDQAFDGPYKSYLVVHVGRATCDAHPNVRIPAADDVDAIVPPQPAQVACPPGLKKGDRIALVHDRGGTCHLEPVGCTGDRCDLGPWECPRWN